MRRGLLVEVVPLIRRSIQEASGLRANLCMQRHWKFQDPSYLRNSASKQKLRAEAFHKDNYNKLWMSMQTQVNRLPFFGLTKNPQL